MNLDCKEVFEIIRQKLYIKCPFSLIRFGDGEARTFSFLDDKDSAQFVMKRQFNKPLSELDILTIQQYMIHAYKSADIVGLPVEIHLKDDMDFYWKRSHEIFNKNVIRDQEVVHGEGNDLTCSIDIHTELLTGDYLTALLQDRDELFYVSGRNLDQDFKRRYGIREVNSFIISPEMKFEANKDKPDHWPNQFEDMRSWMQEIDCKGKLCLVGGGILGKVYTHWFKHQGGIAIDLGNVFDKWAGKVTRGPKRGTDSWDDTYKL